MGAQILGDHRQAIAHLRSPNQLSFVVWEVGVGLESSLTSVIQEYVLTYFALYRLTRS